MADVVKITFPDGAVKEFPKGVTTEEIAASISPGLKKKAVAGKLNDEMIDLRTPIEEDGAVSIITLDSEDGLYILRHSTAHLLAQALKRLYPDVKLGVGPVIENGFYYDIDLSSRQLSQDDFSAIESEMKKIIAEDQPFERFTTPIDEAIAWAKENGQPYKEELLNDLKRAGT